MQRKSVCICLLCAHEKEKSSKRRPENRSKTKSVSYVETERLDGGDRGAAHCLRVCVHVCVCAWVCMCVCIWVLEGLFINRTVSMVKF